VVRAFERRSTTCEPWPDPHTVAFGITVPKPLGDFLVLDALYAARGIAVAVDDAEILAEQARCARLEGLLICPEGAATLAAVRRLRDSSWLERSAEVVVLNTGLGLKYPESLAGTGTQT
jgi:threonine synthase